MEFKFLQYGGGKCLLENGEQVPANKKTVTTPATAKACATECENDANCKGWEYSSDGKCSRMNVKVRGVDLPRKNPTKWKKGGKYCKSNKVLDNNSPNIEHCARLTMDKGGA